MPILTHLPVHRQPRERLWEHGANQLSLEELLAVLLGSGSAEHGVFTLSSHIAEMLRYGPASIQELARIPGIGPAKAAVIAAALELPSAVARQTHQALTEPQQVYVACQDLLNLQQEHVVVFHLTGRNQALHREIATIGTATASLVHPREVFRAAILHNATAIVMAHNHPSGDPTPSEADIQATKRILSAGREVGIELIDHVICATSGYTSLRVTHPDLFF